MGVEVEVGIGVEVVAMADTVGIDVGVEGGEVSVEVGEVVDIEVSDFVEIAGSSVSMRSDENPIFLFLARIRITFSCSPASLILSRDLVNDEKECL